MARREARVEPATRCPKAPALPPWLQVGLGLPVLAVLWGVPVLAWAASAEPGQVGVAASSSPYSLRSATAGSSFDARTAG